MDGTPPCRVDEQSTRHTSTPKGRFVLRADSIRPYRVNAFIRVFAKIQGCGRVREPPYRYNPRRVIVRRHCRCD